MNWPDVQKDDPGKAIGETLAWSMRTEMCARSNAARRRSRTVDGVCASRTPT